MDAHKPRIVPFDRTGIPNKSTARVREQIATLAEAGIDQLWGWLLQIKDPAKRAELFLRALEYHTPKLARSEVTGADGGPQQHTYRWIEEDEEQRSA